MADNPPAIAILGEVRAGLEVGLAPGFAQKVAANALGIALRELERPDTADPATCARLSAAIRDGADDAGLVGELIAMAIAKLEIDQPAYPGYATWRSDEG